MENNLLPCPFFGGEAELNQYCKNGLRIKCKSCLIKKEQKVLMLSMDWLREHMIKDWNTRTTLK